MRDTTFVPFPDGPDDSQTNRVTIEFPLHQWMRPPVGSTGYCGSYGSYGDASVGPGSAEHHAYVSGGMRPSSATVNAALAHLRAAPPCGYQRKLTGANGLPDLRATQPVLSVVPSVPSAVPVPDPVPTARPLTTGDLLLTGLAAAAQAPQMGVPSLAAALAASTWMEPLNGVYYVQPDAPDAPESATSSDHPTDRHARPSLEYAILLAGVLVALVAGMLIALFLTF